MREERHERPKYHACAIVGPTQPIQARHRSSHQAHAWTGAATIAATCAVIGIFFAVFPTLWLHLFTDAEDIIALGTSYLRVVGPIYSLYGLGMGLYFATQGFGNAPWTVAANAVRVLVSSAIALIAVYWLGLGALGFFVSIAVGFCTYAALTLVAALRVREPLPAQVA